ncbi:MAG: prenyltransferase [Ilumatobacteraceae bacterium]
MTANKGLVLPHLPGVITADEVAASAAHLASLQRPSGMIPWFTNGHCDPWNHVESAMALDIAGRSAEAELAYDWLAQVQRPDGAWHNYYVGDHDGDRSISERKLDTNVCAYVATGAVHHALCAPSEHERDRRAQQRWPMVNAALSWVLAQRRSDGLVLWAVEEDDRPWDYALLTGTSSIQHALRCGAVLAGFCGEDADEWLQAADHMRDAITTRPNSFEDKSRWAMDWYYPVLTGALTESAAIARLASGWDTFIMDGLGTRCVSDEPWVTASETAETALAFAAIGDVDSASQLLSWTRSHRRDDGSYWTGIVHPDRIVFPDGEHTSYTAAAVVLAADSICQSSPASSLFRFDLANPLDR